MKKDGLDIGICDDVRNDWLARELREENYHGCMDHGGAHAEGRANNRGWAAKSAMREGYRECASHEKQHFRMGTGKNPTNPLKILVIVLAIILFSNIVVTGLLSVIFT